MLQVYLLINFLLSDIHSPSENSQRLHCAWLLEESRRPSPRTPMEALVKKTYLFADKVWGMYVCKNIHDTRWVL